MNSFEIPDDQLRARLWQELSRAPHDRHHEWRTPTLATHGLFNQGPQARTVVLRHADALLGNLRVFTDARSPKCAELSEQPMAQLTFWSKRLNWQLRVSAIATIELDGEQVNEALERIKQSPARADYLSDLPPGHIQTTCEGITGECSESHSVHHLAVLNFKVTSIDWLALSANGHRRAMLTPDGALMRLVP